MRNVLKEHPHLRPKPGQEISNDQKKAVKGINEKWITIINDPKFFLNISQEENQPKPDKEAKIDEESEGKKVSFSPKE